MISYLLCIINANTLARMIQVVHKNDREIRNEPASCMYNVTPELPPMKEGGRFLCY